MAKLTPLELPDAKAFGAQFGLEVVAIRAMDAGSVNSNFTLTCADGSFCFARIYEEQSEQGAEAERRLLRELSAFGIPTAVPFSSSDGGGLLFHRGKPLSLYPWVEGVHLCTSMVIPERAWRLGATLARVHLATPTLTEVPAGRFDFEGIRKRLEIVQRETTRFDSHVRSIAERLDRYGAERNEGLPSGLVHGDLFRDNVVWRGDDIVALLDFESACAGPFVYDLCVCILAWCYSDAFQMENVRALVAGYRSARDLSDAELAGMRVEGAIACLRFATTRLTDFSLRCPPGAAPTRNFVRFLDRLRAIESGALDSL